MSEKSTRQYRELSGSFLPLKPRRKILFIFSRVTDSWLTKYIKGFNHVVIAEYFEGGYLVIVEPLLVGGSISWRPMPVAGEWDNYTIIEVHISPTRKQKLVRPLLQTCATICQYLAGISLGAVLAQTLYERLMCGDKSYLMRNGVRRVIAWEQKQRP